MTALPESRDSVLESIPKPASSPKPANRDRSLPTVSFSITVAQLDRMREVAYARDVSLSRVAREAINLALAVWATADKPPTDSPPQRAPVRWPADLRRQAARSRPDALALDSLDTADDEECSAVVGEPGGI